MASAIKHKRRSQRSYRDHARDCSFANFESKAQIAKARKVTQKSFTEVAKGFFKQAFKKKGDK